MRGCGRSAKEWIQAAEWIQSCTHTVGRCHVGLLAQLAAAGLEQVVAWFIRIPCGIEEYAAITVGAVELHRVGSAAGESSSACRCHVNRRDAKRSNRGIVAV